MWIQSTISYQSQVEDEPKTITESYLHNAVSFTDAETQLHANLTGRVSEFEVEALARIRKGEVVFFAHQEGDYFWKVKTRYNTENAAGKVKVAFATFFLAALNDVEASARTREFLKNALVPYEIINVDVTKVLAVYWPNNEIWEGDWLNRMDDLSAQGKRSSHLNQLDLFDGDVRNTYEKDRDQLASDIGLNAEEIEGGILEEGNTPAEEAADRLADGETGCEAETFEWEEIGVLNGQRVEADDEPPVNTANSESRYPAKKVTRPAKRRKGWVAPA